MAYVTQLPVSLGIGVMEESVLCFRQMWKTLGSNRNRDSKNEILLTSSYWLTASYFYYILALANLSVMSLFAQVLPAALNK